MGFSLFFFKENWCLGKNAAGCWTNLWDGTPHCRHHSSSMDEESKACPWDTDSVMCQNKWASDWEKMLPLRKTVPVLHDLHWHFSAVSLSLVSHSPTHLLMLIIALLSGETVGMWWHRQHHLCQHLLASCQLPLSISFATYLGAAHVSLPKHEQCPSGNNPVCKTSLQEMGFLTCRFNTSEIIVCD